MEQSKTTINLTPVSFVLAVIFTILKLTGAVSWSWAWVLSPLWIPVGLVLTFGIVMFSIFVIVSVSTGRSIDVSVRGKR